MESFTNRNLPGPRLGLYAILLLVVAALLVAAGVWTTLLLWSGDWKVVLLLVADGMLVAVAATFLTGAGRILRKRRLEIQRIEMDGEQMTVYYVGWHEAFALGECRIERAGGEEEGWDFRIRSGQGGIQLLSSSFSEAESLRALLRRWSEGGPDASEGAA